MRGTTIQWIDDQKVPYASKNNEWVGYDNKESYEIKVGNTSIHRGNISKVRLQAGIEEIVPNFVVDSYTCSINRSST